MKTATAAVLLEPQLGCQNKALQRNCCTDKGCGENHKYILWTASKAAAPPWAMTANLCTECGKIEKRVLYGLSGPRMAGIVIRDATCETDGKLAGALLPLRTDESRPPRPRANTAKSLYRAATCTSPGYTVRSAPSAAIRHIEEHHGSICPTLRIPCDLRHLRKRRQDHPPL